MFIQCVRNTLTNDLFWSAGLDPAGPCYSYPCNASLDDRLDASDAAYVSCIHTNIGFWGQAPTCGCQDFYINNAVYQPGGIGNQYAHYFACTLFDWTLNVTNQCFSAVDRQQLGIHAQERKCGTYRVNTGRQSNECRFSTENV